MFWSPIQLANHIYGPMRDWSHVSYRWRLWACALWTAMSVAVGGIVIFIMLAVVGLFVQFPVLFLLVANGSALLTTMAQLEEDQPSCQCHNIFACRNGIHHIIGA